MNHFAIRTGLIAIAVSLAFIFSASSLLSVAGPAPVNGLFKAHAARFAYPFQNPDLPEEERVANIISLLTLEEKIDCLGTNPSVPRLGIKASGHVEGIHGLTQGGPAKWGRPATIPTTTFPQGIGPRADEVDLDWYSGTPPYRVTPLEGIRAKVGAGVRVGYAKDNAEGAAVQLARGADVALVLVGNHPTCGEGWGKCPDPSQGKEAFDRKSIALPDEELIREVYRANPRTIVVLVSSFPYAINWTQEHIPAILHMAHNSQEEGNALADVLFGDYNPAGRLVQTWPRSLDQLPPMMDYDIRHGRTYMYSKGEPLYPFGYGLSYTTFAYTNLRTSARKLPASGSIKVSVDVRNTGRRDGEEVVQLYVRHLQSKIARPLKELKGFARVALRPGQTKTVALELKADHLAYWDASRHAFVVENDQVEITVGRSSADAGLKRIVRVLF